MMLSKKYRISSERDFKKIYKNTSKLRSRFLSLRVLVNHKKESRFGFVIPNHILRKATERNSVKRILRAEINQNQPRIIAGFDVIIKLERVAEKESLRRDLVELLRSRNLIHD